MYNAPAHMQLFDKFASTDCLFAERSRVFHTKVFAKDRSVMPPKTRFVAVWHFMTFDIFYV
jgi:hypothetical protein